MHCIWNSVGWRFVEDICKLCGKRRKPAHSSWPSTNEEIEVKIEECLFVDLLNSILGLLGSHSVYSNKHFTACGFLKKEVSKQREPGKGERRRAANISANWIKFENLKLFYLFLCHVHHSSAIDDDSTVEFANGQLVYRQCGDFKLIAPIWQRIRLRLRDWKTVWEVHIESRWKVVLFELISAVHRVLLLLHQVRWNAW